MTSNLYTFLAVEKKYVCNQCGMKFTNRLSSVKRHIERRHSIKYNGKQIDNTSEDECNQSVVKKFKSDSLQTHLNANQFLKCCVGLVAVENIPFRIFDDEEFFKVLIQPYEKEFGTNLNSKNIITTVKAASSTICTMLSDRLKNKLVSLKVDIATRMNVSIIGIDVQYIRDFKICVNTLGVIQLKKMHTALNIKDEILKCLNGFGIELSQIYSITTDNKAPVLKAIRILQDLQEKRSTGIAPVMSGISCGAYTVQLAAHDVLKTLHPKIENCRKAVEKLRMAIPTDDCGEPMPTMDNETRWISTFNMLYSLLNMKKFIHNQDPQEEYTHIDWDFVKNFITAFEPLAICTNKLQFEQCTIGDFYRDWRMCELDVEFLISKTPYAEPLHNALQSRRQLMLKNKAFLAALYLDPRYNFEKSVLLSDNQKLRALAHLVQTNHLLQKIDADGKDACDEQESDSFVSECSPYSAAAVPTKDVPCTSLITLQRYEQRLSEECNFTASTIKDEKLQTIEEKLMLLSKRKRVSCNTDVLEYWKTQSNDKDMNRLVQIALAVPVTQISVEKSFSALSLVLMELQAKMSDTSIKPMLLTKLNFDLLRPVDVKIINSCK